MNSLPAPSPNSRVVGTAEPVTRQLKTFVGGNIPSASAQLRQPSPGPLTAAIDRITPDLLADNAQVVFGFEVLDPVIEEADAVRLAKLIQFVEPDRLLAQPIPEVF